MTFADWLIVLMAVQCALAATWFAILGKWAQSVTFYGYTIANAGLLWMSLKA